MDGSLQFDDPSLGTRCTGLLMLVHDVDSFDHSTVLLCYDPDDTTGHSFGFTSDDLNCVAFLNVELRRHFFLVSAVYNTSGANDTIFIY